MLDLNKLVTSLSAMLRRLIGEDIDLQLALGPDLGMVSADPGQIEQVLMNLVVNARDAMPKGGTLTIETANVQLDEGYTGRHLTVKPGPYAQIAVSDNGGGMDEATQARLFEPFFTTKGVGRGTGLGLSTVFGIVKQSGGNLDVYSVPNRGTSVKVYLPRIDQPAAVEAESLRSTVTSRVGDRPAGGRRRDGAPPGSRDPGARRLQGDGHIATRWKRGACRTVTAGRSTC